MRQTLPITLAVLCLANVGTEGSVIAQQAPLQAPAQQRRLAALPAAQLYVLTENSQSIQGCFTPCQCPVFFFGRTLGTFRIRPVPGPQDGFRHFVVTDVDWLRTFGVESHVTGSGRYRVGRENGVLMHELVLDLSLDGAPLDRFDSGLVPGGSRGTMPRITLSIDANDQVCFDSVFNIDAVALPRGLTIPYEIGAGSVHSNGCLPPCLCAISAQNLRGSFKLVPLGISDGFQRFAVLDMRLGVGGFVDLEPLPTTRIAHGSGFYSIADDRSGLQSMELFLNVAGVGLEPFHSGDVFGGALPAIEISVADNDFVCLNRVFSLLSTPE